MENIQILGKSNRQILRVNGLESLQRVHLSKGTKIIAHGGYMEKQEFVIYDDNMNAVEIASNAQVSETDLDKYFSPLQKIEEEVRPISKKFGIGFYYDESGVLVPDEIIEISLERAKNFANLKERMKVEKEEKEKRIAKELKEEYSYLTQWDGNKTICGDNIRKELKKKFPGAKFSVRYKSFSGGDEYYVTWTDGPTAEEVDKVILKYQHSHRDWSGDYWDYDPSVFNGLFGGVKYIMSQRTISDEFKAQVREEYKDLTEDNKHDYIFKEGDSIGNLTIRYDYSVEDIITAICRNRSVEDKQEVAIIKSSASDIEIVDYSEKAIAVIGDTKSIKDGLKKLGGRFNARLTCGAGWVFSKTKLEEVKQYLNK